jgi:signal transduction histidine kinase
MGEDVVVAAPTPDLWLEDPWPWMLRVRRLVDRHPQWVDLFAAIALGLLTAVPLIYSENRWWVWVLNMALILPLVFRRLRPTQVFLLISGVAFIQWLADVPLAADAALLVALYTVAEHQTRTRALLAAGVLEVGVVLASVRFAPPGESVVSSLVLLTGMVTAALFVGMTLRTRRAYLATLVDRAARLEAERDREAELAATRERNRIAREMHDIVAHSLSVVIALADGAALTNAQDSAAATDAMRMVSATGRQSMAEMRRLLGVLREDSEPSGLAPQPGLERLPELADRLSRVGPSLELVVTGEPRLLPPTEDATAYRIIQESLTNVVKHATGVTKVSLLLDWRPEVLKIQVIDNGTPAVTPGASEGHGLTGMSERVALFAGRFAAGPEVTGGWRVEALLPISPA